jgi:DNA polymerase-4
MVEPFGIDESWLDVTGSRKLFGTGLEIAKKISEEVKSKIGITLSIGVSFNKVFAKLGSDYKKPDAITVISRENFKNIVYPLPVSSLLFVGKKTEAALLRMGVRTIGELAECNVAMLKEKLGKAGEMLHKYSMGDDDSIVAPSAPEDAKSISNGITFRHDLRSADEYRIGIEYLAEEVGSRLREKGLKCSTVQLTIKDEYLRTIQRQRPQSPPSDIGSEIAESAFEILKSEWSIGKPIRMLTVAAVNLVSANSLSEQISLFDNVYEKDRDKKRKSEKTIDKIRQKYGDGAIIKGAVLDTDLGIYTAPKKKNIKNQ